MSKRDPWSFNWLALSGLIVLLPHITRIPAWLSLLFVAGLLWQWSSVYRGWRVPGGLIRLVLTIFLLIATFKEFGTLLGRDAGTGLLVGLAGLKFMELRTLRDYTVLTFIYYLLVGVDFLHDQELIHGAYLLVTVFTTTATLVRLNLPTTNDWRYSLGLAGGMLLRSLPLMLVMYLLFPRMHGGLWSLPSDAHAGITGLASEISAGSISNLVQSDAAAFRVEFESGKVPPPEQRYWRALVLWYTDGKRWKRVAAPYVNPDQLGVKTTGEPVEYIITLEASGKLWRPALDLPLEQNPDSRYRTGYLLEAKQKQLQRVRYSLRSWPNYNTGPLPDYERRIALQLPKRISKRTRELVEDWRRSSTSDQELVSRALRHFNGQRFRYTLKPPLLGSDPIDEFLFETQAGFCEHYATTFAALMRLAGIPSRVVAGYQGGELNEGGGYLKVSQSDAHAWTEVWLPGRGWVRADPTAAIAPERIELGSEAIRRLEARGLQPGQLTQDVLNDIVRLGWLENLWRQSRHAWDAVNLAWFRWTTGYDIDKQLELLRQLGFAAPGWFGLIIGLFAGVMLFVAAMLFSLKRSERDHEPLRAIYRRFEAKLHSVGLERSPAEGPVDFAFRASATKPTLAQAINQITNLYVSLRYGQLASAGLSDLATLRQLVRSFRPDKLLANTEA